MFNASITLGDLNFSVPELHKLVLQGKKCINGINISSSFRARLQQCNAEIHGQSVDNRSE